MRLALNLISWPMVWSIPMLHSMMLIPTRMVMRFVPIMAVYRSLISLCSMVTIPNYGGRIVRVILRCTGSSLLYGLRSLLCTLKALLLAGSSQQSGAS
jgi:hypothetical protein